MEEEIKSWNRIERILISLRQGMDRVIPNLKQIDFSYFIADPFNGYFNLDFNSNIEPKFSNKNFTVEEITFRFFSKTLNLELLKQLFDALPNTMRVRIVLFKPLLNMLEFLKIISDLKNLKSLHFAMNGLQTWCTKHTRLLQHH